MSSPSGPEKTILFHVFLCSWRLLSRQCGPPSLPEALPALHQGCGGACQAHTNSLCFEHTCGKLNGVGAGPPMASPAGGRAHVLSSPS